MKIILTFSLSHKKRKTRKRKFQKINKLTFILLFSKLQSKSKVFRLLLSSKPTFSLKFWSKKSFYGDKVSFQFFCPTIIMTSFWLQWLWNCCCKVGSCFWRKRKYFWLLWDLYWGQIRVQTHRIPLEKWLFMVAFI